jgi:hypothetical protein
MSPTASFDTNAYGTLRVGWRGVISGSEFTAIPQYIVAPVHKDCGIGVTLPSSAEK